MANERFLTPTGYRNVASLSGYIPYIGATANVNLGGHNITANRFFGPLTGNVTGNADTVTTNADLTGPVTSVGNATSISSSINLPGNPTTTTQPPLTNNSTIATTAYADSAVASAISSVFIFKGVIDCSANPNYPAAAIGDTYRISVAGKIGGASGVDVVVNDTVYCWVTNGGGTQAAVGADFVIIHQDETGEVIGPSSATDSSVALFDGTTGKLIKNSSLTVSGSTITGNITGNAGTVTNGVISDVSSTVGGVHITNIMSISAAAYALITPDPTTLYFIT